MYSYRIRGENYDTIVVDPAFIDGSIRTYQYYTKNGYVNETNVVIFNIEPCADSIVLRSIDTECSDTVVIPKMLITRIAPNVLEGTSFRRLIVPLNMSVTLCDKALYGSDVFEEYRSLSRQVTYEGDVFPPSVKRRIV